MDDFGANYVTITDEDGNHYEMEILSRFFCDDAEYIALTPADAADEDAELSVNILRVVNDGGEELLDAITDEDEMQRAYDALMELVFEEDDETE